MYTSCSQSDGIDYSLHSPKIQGKKKKKPSSGTPLLWASSNYFILHEIQVHATLLHIQATHLTWTYMWYYKSVVLWTLPLPVGLTNISFSYKIARRSIMDQNVQITSHFQLGCFSSRQDSGEKTTVIMKLKACSKEACVHQQMLSYSISTSILWMKEATFMKLSMDKPLSASLSPLGLSSGLSLATVCGIVEGCPSCGAKWLTN